MKSCIYCVIASDCDDHSERTQWITSRKQQHIVSKRKGSTKKVCWKSPEFVLPPSRSRQDLHRCLTQNTLLSNKRCIVWILVICHCNCDVGIGLDRNLHSAPGKALPKQPRRKDSLSLVCFLCHATFWYYLSLQTGEYGRAQPISEQKSKQLPKRTFNWFKMKVYPI